MPRNSGNETLESYLSLNYLVKVSSLKGKYLVFITELSLLEEDEDLNTAFARLEDAKKRRLTQMVEAGMQRLIPLPSALEQRRHWLYSLKPFAVKVFVVILLVAAGAWGIHKTPLPGLVPTLELVVAKINDIPDDKYQQISRKTRRAMKKLRPVIDEVLSELSTPTARPAPAVSPAPKQIQETAK